MQQAIPYFCAHLGEVESQWKADETRVTEADLHLSRLFEEGLRTAFPEDDFCSEEDAATETARPLQATYAWVVDPIDGTNNFALGFPSCAISLGLLRDGEPIYGWIYDAARRVVIEGGPGYGVTCGGRNLPSLIPHNPVRDTIYVAVHTPWGEQIAPALAPLLEVCKIRAMGSSALHLALVAGGIYDAAVDFNVKVWDIAAGVAIARALGAEVHFFNGPVFPLRTFSVRAGPLHYFACRPGLGDRLRALIRYPRDSTRARH